MKALVNGKLIMASSILEDKVLIYDKKIIDILEKHEVSGNTDMEIVDVKGSYISPGFIDLHVHGAGGRDTMEGTMEALGHIRQTVTKSGITSILPTTMTMGKAWVHQALKVIRESRDIKEGANVLGANLEGPFISRVYKGAHDETFIIKPDYTFIKDYVDVIKIITIAPEEDENLSFIRQMKEHKDIVLSIGHSNATFEEAVDAFHQGVSHVTHTFNAMNPLHHRKPGVVGAVFSNEVTCELIVDKIHVHPGIFQLFADIMGKDNVILITDAMCGAYLQDGQYELGGQRVTVEKGSARLQDGTLAGSTLTMNTAVKNMVENTKLTLYEAVNLASLNPARRLGIEKQKGRIEVGLDADITVFDENFNICRTIVQGEHVYVNMVE